MTTIAKRQKTVYSVAGTDYDTLEQAHEKWLELELKTMLGSGRNLEYTGRDISVATEIILRFWDNIRALADSEENTRSLLVALEKGPCTRCGEITPTLQVDSYLSDVEGDHSLYFICDDCNDKAADDI